MKYCLVIPVTLVVVLGLATPTHTLRINSKVYSKSPHKVHADNTIHTQRNENAIAYVKASIPIRIFQCMQRLNIMKCMKIFILQRMERTRGTYTNSGNLTADFLDQILAEDNASVDIFDDAYYVQMNESLINERLLNSFQRFFTNREIKLHFIPGMVVKVVPSSKNLINMSVKKAYDDLTVARKQKNHAQYLLQFGVPALVMPAILLGTVLPFVLPVLKMATIVSGMINNGALLTAVLYAAKNAALAPENKVYYNAGYHRGMTSW